MKIKKKRRPGAYKRSLMSSRIKVEKNPEKQILTNLIAYSFIFLLVTSTSASNSLLASNLDLNENYNYYLSKEDIEFNTSQLITTDEGFLLKTIPVTNEAELDNDLNFQVHQLQPLENLESVAQMYDLDIQTLIWENEIVNVDSIKPGDSLRVPPIDGITHVIKTGDNLTSLAKKYDVDYTLIDKFNTTNTRQLQLGDRVFIPGGKRIEINLIAEKTEDTQEENLVAKNNEPAPVLDLEDESNIVPKLANLETDVNANILPNIPQPDIDPGTTTEIPIRQRLDSVVDYSAQTDKVINPIKEVVVTKEILKQTAPKTNGFWGKVTVGTVTQGYRAGHYALDIANVNRPNIWAAADGIVETAEYGWNGGYGNYIIVDHQNGYKTLYAHNEKLFVGKGDKVSKGQVLAQMGNSGRVYGATGIHIHYECHLKGARINPYTCMQ